MASGHILVVDDEPDIRSLVQDILQDEGYQVSVAENAAAARELRRQIRPDAILLDIWMPDTDGISLLREWSERGGLSCPVIMISGHGTVETAVEATRLGAYDFVEKPLSLAKLLLGDKSIIPVLGVAEIMVALSLLVFFVSVLITWSRSKSASPAALTAAMPAE